MTLVDKKYVSFTYLPNPSFVSFTYLRVKKENLNKDILTFSILKIYNRCNFNY